MNRAELISKIASDTKVKKAVVSSVLDTLFNTITQEIQSGSSVHVIELGTFSSVVRKARTINSGITGTACELKERRVTKFKPSVQLKAAMKSAVLT